MKSMIFAALPLAVLAGACATITRGTTEAFVVETDPSGAHVATSTGLSCDATPCTFPRIPRESEFGVTITREGYETWTGSVTHQMAGGGGAGMAGNVILGGLIGAAVDANNGSTQELVPNPLRVTLTPIAEPAPTPEAVAAVEPAVGAAAEPAATGEGGPASGTPAR